MFTEAVRSLVVEGPGKGPHLRRAAVPDGAALAADPGSALRNVRSAGPLAMRMLLTLLALAAFIACTIAHDVAHASEEATGRADSGFLDALEREQSHPDGHHFRLDAEPSDRELELREAEKLEEPDDSKEGAALATTSMGQVLICVAARPQGRPRFASALRLRKRLVFSARPRGPPSRAH